jgi:hypothetical protein
MDAIKGMGRLMKLVDFSVKVNLFVEPAVVAQSSLSGRVECFSDVLR